MYINLHEVDDFQKAIYESDDKECAICLEEINDSKCIVLKCNHIYHKKCINAWLKKNETCPMCRVYLKQYYYGCVYNSKKLNFPIKFTLILNDDHFIIKYYYKYTNIFKKRIVLHFKKIKYFSYTGRFFSYDYLDDESKIIKKEILSMNSNNMAENLFSLLKDKVTQISQNQNNQNSIYEN